MKRVSFILLIMLLVLGSTTAQQTKRQKAPLTIMQVNAPKNVLTQVEKHNPGLNFEKEPVVASTKKEIDRQRAAAENEIDYSDHYTVRTRTHAPNGKSSGEKTSIYSPDGTLISYREVSRNKALPIVALRTIGKKYDGWLLLRTKAVTRFDGTNTTAVYDVVLKNGKNKERVQINEAGEIITNKKNSGEEKLNAQKKNSDRKNVKG